MKSDQMVPPLVQIDAATATVTRTVDFSSAGIWIAASADGVWASGLRPDEPNTAAAFVVPASGGPPEEVGSVHNFRPFAVAEGRVWFSSGPNDPGLPKGGICGLNISTHEVDVCAQPQSIAELGAAHDPAAYEPMTNTIWVGEYESSYATKVQVGVAAHT